MKNSKYREELNTQSERECKRLRNEERENEKIIKRVFEKGKREKIYENKFMRNESKRKKSG